jgi:hypothetical protein
MRIIGLWSFFGESHRLVALSSTGHFRASFIYFGPLSRSSLSGWRLGFSLQPAAGGQTDIWMGKRDAVLSLVCSDSVDWPVSHNRPTNVLEVSTGCRSLPSPTTASLAALQTPRPRLGQRGLSASLTSTAQFGARSIRVDGWTTTQLLVLVCGGATRCFFPFLFCFSV